MSRADLAGARVSSAAEEFVFCFFWGGVVGGVGSAIGLSYFQFSMQNFVPMMRLRPTVGVLLAVLAVAGVAQHSAEAAATPTAAGPNAMELSANAANKSIGSADNSTKETPAVLWECDADVVGEDRIALCDSAAAALNGEARYMEAIARVNKYHKQFDAGHLAVVHALESAAAEVEVSLKNAFISQKSCVERNHTKGCDPINSTATINALERALESITKGEEAHNENMEPRNEWRLEVEKAVGEENVYAKKLGVFKKLDGFEFTAMEQRYTLVQEQVTKQKQNLLRQLDVAKNRSLAAKTAAANIALSPGEVDRIFLASRRAASAAAATRRYLDSLEHELQSSALELRDATAEKPNYPVPADNTRIETAPLDNQVEVERLHDASQAAEKISHDMQ